MYKVMQFNSDFYEYARAQGIRDPFRASREIPTRAEKDAWIRMRDEYIARRCFYEIGYESFLFHTKPHDYECNYDISHLREEDEFVPCLSADRQCMMTCHRYAECALQGTRKPE